MSARPRRDARAVTDAERYRYCATSCGGSPPSGITGAHGMDGTLETLDLLRELEGNGDLAIAARHAATGRSPRRAEEVWEAYAAAPRRARAALARRRREVLHRRRHRLAAPAGSSSPTARATGSRRSGPTPARTSAPCTSSPARGFQVRHARHRRPRRARGARRLPRRGRRAGHPPPDRAHRDAPARRPAALRGRGRGRLDAAAAHDVARARPLGQLVAAARRRRALRPRVPRRATCVESGATVALGSDWPVARYDWRGGHGRARSCAARPG